VALKLLVLSMLAWPFYVAGVATATAVTAGRWCAAAFALGLDAGRRRWKRAG
jgi:hypothetical protein